MTFYSTPETLSESVNPSPAYHKADITETQYSSQENIRDNTVDSLKRTELAAEIMNDSPIIDPNTSDYGQDISVKSSSVETRNEENNDKEEMSQEKTEVYTESTSFGETSKREENDKEEAQGNSEVYVESTSTEETSMRKEDNKVDLQQGSTKVYTESSGSEETSRREGNDEEEKQDNTKIYTESTSTEETSKKEGNDEEEKEQDNTKIYTESTGTEETSKKVGNDEEEKQDNTKIYTGNTGTEETSKKAGNDGEEKQGNIKIYTGNTATGETSKEEWNGEEEQQDNTEIYAESTSNADLFTTHSAEEDEMNISSGQIKNKIAETVSDQTTTAQNNDSLDSEKAKNNKVNSADDTTTVLYPSDYNGMLKDGGGLWHIGELEKSSVETVTYETSQETIHHETATNTSEDDNERGSGTESIQSETSVDSREGIDDGIANEPVEDDNESKMDSGKLGQDKYGENNPEADSFENSNTTIIPEEHTQASEHEPKDAVPVITLENDIESSNMGIVLPDLDNDKMQVDYDITKIQTNPLVSREAEINTSSGNNNITNSTEDDQNESDLDGKTLQTSNKEDSEGITTDESTGATFTTTPATEVTSEFQTTETTETSELKIGHGKTSYRTKISLSVASLLMHDGQTKEENEEIMTPTDGSTTPDILEGEYPLNAKGFEQTTEHTDTTATAEVQDVTTVNSVGDNSSTEQTTAILYTSDEGISHTEPVRESFTDSFGNTGSSDETETIIYSTTDATEPNEKILVAAVTLESNETANNSETSDILPHKWLKDDKHTKTEASTEVVPQPSPNEDKTEESSSTAHYSLDEIRHSHESKSAETTDQPVGTDTTKPEWTTESMLTTFNSLENTHRFDNRPSSDDSQTSADESSNEIHTTEDNGGDTASEEMDATSKEYGTLTTSDYNLKEIVMPFQHSPFFEHSEEHNGWEDIDTSNSDAISKKNFDVSEGSKGGGSDESESWNSNTDKKSGAKEPNKLDKNHPEYLQPEDNSTNYDQHTSDEYLSVKEVKSTYSGDSYEQFFHDIYGPGDYYVSSSESGLTYSTTDEDNEVISTVTSPSTEEQFTESTVLRSRDDEDKESYLQVYVDTDTTTAATDSSTTTTTTTATNKTESALETTTSGLLKNVYNSAKITNLSDTKVEHSVEDSQDIKLENMGMFKVEDAQYDHSESNEENDSVQ
jgi:hypothetical protein